MPPTPDADAVLAEEQGTEATALWAACQFDAAYQTLQRIEVTLPSDARVQLNLLTAEYIADNAGSLKQLLQQLEDWLDFPVLELFTAVVRQQSCAAEQLNSTTDNAHPAQPGEPGQHNIHAVAAVNYSLLLYVQQQHASALSVLEPLFSDVDLLHDGVGLCVCLLLLEIYLSGCLVPRAVQVIQYLQGQAAAAAGSRSAVTADRANTGQDTGKRSQCSSPEKQQPSPEESPGHHHQPPHHEGPQQVGQAAQVEGNEEQGPETAKPGLVVPLCQALPMLSKTKGPFMQQVYGLIKERGGRPPGQDLSPLLHLYKARLALACLNHRAAKKEVRSLLADQPMCATGLLLKAQLEVIRQQPRKALKTLDPLLTMNHTDSSSRSRLQLLNVLAAVHDQLGKHNTAVVYLSTALNLHAQAQQQQCTAARVAGSTSREASQEQRSMQQTKQQNSQQGAAAVVDPSTTTVHEEEAVGLCTARQRPWLLPDYSDALYFNLGLQQLSLQDWQGAMESFEAAAAGFYMQPGLWLRWAEACLGLYHQQQQQQQHVYQQPQQQVGKAGAAGSMDASDAVNTQSGSAQGEAGMQQHALAPEQLLQQASAHLSTGLLLLQEQQAAAAKEFEAASAAAVTASELSPDRDAPGLTPAAIGPPANDGDEDVTSSSTKNAQQGIAHLLAGAGAALHCSGSGLGAASFDVDDIASGSMAKGGPSSPSSAVAADHSRLALTTCPPKGLVLTPALAGIHQSLLSNQAFVSLLLSKPEGALAAAQELLACSNMSPQQHYLGTSYAAEALCLLGRLEEAQQLLQTHLSMFTLRGSSGAQASPVAAVPDTVGPGGTAGHQQQKSLADDAAARPSGPDSMTNSQPAASAASSTATGLTAEPLPMVSSSLAAAESTKSFDGSCISCVKGVCSQGSQWGLSEAAATGMGPGDQAVVLHNLGAVFMLRGDVEEGCKHAAMATAALEVQQAT